MVVPTCSCDHTRHIDMPCNPEEAWVTFIHTWYTFVHTSTAMPDFKASAIAFPPSAPILLLRRLRSVKTALTKKLPN